MASYVDNGNKLDWALSFQRTGNFPIDRSSMFSSYADAVKYAAGNASNPDSRGLQGSSYVGQIITVFENDTVNVYKINADRTLSAIGEGSGGIDVYETTATINSQSTRIFFTDEAYSYIKTNKPFIINASIDVEDVEDVDAVNMYLILSSVTEIDNSELLHYSTQGQTGAISIRIDDDNTSSVGSLFESINIGYLANLTTTNKNSIVNAINEVNAKPSGGSDVYETNVTISNKKIMFTDEAYTYIRTNKPTIIKANEGSTSFYFQLTTEGRNFESSSINELLYFTSLDGGFAWFFIDSNDTASTGSDFITTSFVGTLTIDYFSSDAQIINQLKSIFINNRFGEFPVLKHNNDYLPFLGVIYTGDNNNITKFDFGYTLDNTFYHARLTLTENDGLYELTKSYETSNSIGDLSDLTTTAKNNLVAAINEINQGGGGGGSSDYEDLENQPSINNVTLLGDKTSADLGLASQESITDINSKIPNQASVNNQLADKDFVNSSISTATATFRGNFDSLTTLQATEGDKNDYAFYSHPDSSGNTIYDRYKYVGIPESELPEGYIEVDSINCVGDNGYINTEIVPSSTLVIETALNSPNFNEYAYMYFMGSGAYSVWNDQFSRAMRIRRGGSTQLDILQTTSFEIDSKNTLKIAPNGIYVNGTNIGSVAFEDTATNPIYLFTNINNDGTFSPSYVATTKKIYRTKFINNNEVIADMIPCYREIDYKAGFYDVVRNKFYINDKNENNFTYTQLSTDKWEYEYSLSNLNLTSAQWATLNSGLVANVTSTGYDATKTQVLKNINGTLTWVTEE